jgi:hypothetical protein
VFRTRFAGTYLYIYSTQLYLGTIPGSDIYNPLQMLRRTAHPIIPSTIRLLELFNLIQDSPLTIMNLIEYDSRKSTSESLTSPNEVPLSTNPNPNYMLACDWLI